MQMRILAEVHDSLTHRLGIGVCLVRLLDDRCDVAVSHSRFARLGWVTERVALSPGSFGHTRTGRHGRLVDAESKEVGRNNTPYVSRNPSGGKVMLSLELQPRVQRRVRIPVLFNLQADPTRSRKKADTGDWYSH